MLRAPHALGAESTLEIKDLDVILPTNNVIEASPVVSPWKVERIHVARHQRGLIGVIVLVKSLESRGHRTLPSKTSPYHRPLTFKVLVSMLKSDEFTEFSQ